MRRQNKEQEQRMGVAAAQVGPSYYVYVDLGVLYIHMTSANCMYDLGALCI